jgi:hypothetical protein
MQKLHGKKPEKLISYGFDVYFNIFFYETLHAIDVKFLDKLKEVKKIPKTTCGWKRVSCGLQAGRMETSS